MITAKRGDKQVTRNVSFFKKIPSSVVSHEESESEDNDETLPGERHGQQVLPQPENLRRSQRERRQPNRYGYL